MADRIFHVNIDVSDLDRSIEFSGRLGFEIERRAPAQCDPDGTVIEILSGFDHLVT